MSRMSTDKVIPEFEVLESFQKTQTLSKQQKKKQLINRFSLFQKFDL